MASKPEQSRERTVVARNRRATHDYHIGETYDAGLVLTGSEVKSLRDGKCELRDAYAAVRHGELFMIGGRIAEYEQANRENHEPTRKRKLLLHRVEIDRIEAKLHDTGVTLVPLEVFFQGGWAKVRLGMARGKKSYDKRHAIAERESDRQLQATLKRHLRTRES